MLYKNGILNYLEFYHVVAVIIDTFRYFSLTIAVFANSETADMA